MIYGSFTPDREAVIPLTGANTGGQGQEIRAIIDTGFNGYLTLPPDLASQLNLPLQAQTKVTLADGTETFLNVVEVNLLWETQSRTIPALLTEGTPLAGASLLYGCRLTIEMVDGGLVSIEPMQ